MVEPPYGIIWSRMRTGRVVPFLGAAASFVGRPIDAIWDPDDSAFLPRGAELARFLATQSRFPSKDAHDLENLAKVSSYFVDAGNRTELKFQLRKTLNRAVEPGAIHHFLARVPAPQLIVVTNYDTLLERAFRAADTPFDLVVHPADRTDHANSVLWWKDGATEPDAVAPKNLNIDLTTRTVIYKMHGTIDPADDKGDNFVITEEDYVEFLHRMTARSAVPSQFYEHFRDRSFLFLGYSLNDWNLRVMLKNVRTNVSARRGKALEQRDETLKSWAIQKNPSELETSLWETRKIKIFDITIDDFVAELQKEAVP